MPDAPSFKAPVGTHDVLPPASARWEALLAIFAGHATLAGYGLLQSPLFEDLAVFARLGEGTDVVTKEMYELTDKGGRQLALRPEGTAPVVRAFVQHHPPTPWKVWYATPSFRYERPQAGRFRQHHQVGVEVIGSPDPYVDVEVIALGWDYLHALGLTRMVLLLNSMGTPDDRRRFVAHLGAWLDERRRDLAPEDREKIDTHPMRVLDSKREATRAAVVDAPRITDHLSDGAAAHFERVKDGLGALGIPFALEPRLVRGFDYYTNTTFEVQAQAIDAAQSTVLGGGRYDGLVEQLGGPATPGIGFGSGIERALLACDAEAAFPAPPSAIQAFVVDITDGTAARDLTLALRRAGIAADRAFDGRSMRSQMKAADRSGATFAVIVGDDELVAGTVTLRRLRGEVVDQQAVPRPDLVEFLRKQL
ncbi:histidine--tRNA ligase [soil metagenome]